jgi:epoxyqueuosine reductase
LEDTDLSQRIVQVLENLSSDSELVLEHRDWALKRQTDALTASDKTARPGRFPKPLKPAVAKKYYLPK